MPAQLIGTKGWRDRPEPSWMARATSSLPTPLSPVTRTLASDIEMRLDFLAELRHLGAVANQVRVQMSHVAKSPSSIGTAAPLGTATHRLQLDTHPPL